jgi:hypothetical protein
MKTISLFLSLLVVCASVAVVSATYVEQNDVEWIQPALVESLSTVTLPRLLNTDLIMALSPGGQDMLKVLIAFSKKEFNYEGVNCLIQAHALAQATAVDANKLTAFANQFVYANSATPVNLPAPLRLQFEGYVRQFSAPNGDQLATWKTQFSAIANEMINMLTADVLTRLGSDSTARPQWEAGRLRYNRHQELAAALRQADATAAARVQGMTDAQIEATFAPQERQRYTSFSSAQKANYIATKRRNLVTAYATPLRTAALNAIRQKYGS